MKRGFTTWLLNISNPKYLPKCHIFLQVRTAVNPILKIPYRNIMLWDAFCHSFAKLLILIRFKRYHPVEGRTSQTSATEEEDFWGITISPIMWTTFIPIWIVQYRKQDRYLIFMSVCRYLQWVDYKFTKAPIFFGNITISWIFKLCNCMLSQGLTEFNTTQALKWNTYRYSEEKI